MHLSSLFSLVLLAANLAPGQSHGRMTNPKSRNDYANSLGKEFNQNGLSDKTNGGCGAVLGKSYDLPPADVGWKTQAVYNRGQEIDVDVQLTAHHWGHFEFYGCPITQGQTASESCFNQYPLEFVRDLRFNAPKDNNYPNRAYLPPASMGLNYQYRVKLPNTLSGNLVLIQWRYKTGNSCMSPGYSQYPWPWSGVPLNIPACNSGMTNGEMFWNCAEVSIGSGGSPPPPPPPPPPPSPSPPPPSGTCGNGNRGNGVCADSTCCSPFGWCGTSPAHCGTGGGNPGTPSARRSGAFNTYLSAWTDGSVRQAPHSQDWEKWTMTTVSGGKVTFRSFHGTYLSAWPDNTARLAQQAQAWEEWTPVTNSDGSKSYRSFHGTFLSAWDDGGIRLSRNNFAWEHWF